MKILNYTTSISSEKTAGEIQKKLSVAGAQAVLSEYNEDGIMCSMSFRINNIFFKLPINIDGVYSAISKDKNIPRKFKSYEQASRIAWRIIKDWIEAQIAIIQAGQAELIQIFLPYAQDKDGKTVFETIKDNGFKQITSQ